MFCGSVSAGYGSVEGVSAHIGGRGNSDMASRRLLFNLRGVSSRVFLSQDEGCLREMVHLGGSAAARLPCQSVVFHNLHLPKLKGDYSMKKYLSIFVALAMVLSLFAGVGARSAKAATAITVTSAGNFAGGTDAVGVTAVDPIGTIASVVYAGVATVNVTTAGVGVFDAAPNVSVMHLTDSTGVSTDSDWKTLGDQLITFTTVPTLAVGDELTVDATTKGVGTVLSVGGDYALVRVTTAAVGTISGAVTVKTPVTSTLNSIDEDWKTVGTAQQITFTGTTPTLAVGDGVEVFMVQLQSASAAVGFLTLAGTIHADNVGTAVAATWQDTTGALHTASYTVQATDLTLASVRDNLMAKINAVVGGNVTATPIDTAVIQLKQNVKGAVGNGKTLTASSALISLIIKTFAGATQPAYVEVGKTLQLVAFDLTGAVVTPATWTTSNNLVANVTSAGLVMGLNTTGAALITATLSTGESGTFVVVATPTQIITSLAITLVPATPKVAGKQQFAAIATAAGYPALDYTTQAVWSDTLPVAVISNVAPTQGLLTYSTAETGTVTAVAGGLTATATVTIDAAGLVTITTVPVAVKIVIVLTVGSDIVTVDGKATTVDAAPEIVASRTFVPIRFIAETFGSTVTWLPETKGITITLGTTTIGLQIANATAVINGKIIALEAAPYIKNSRTMVPLRVISESFGGDVIWDAAKSTITITYVLPVVPAA